MKAVIQRVSKAHVAIAGQVVGKVNKGLLVLLGINADDATDDAKYIVKKCVNLRIFSDDHGKMNKSVQDISGEILLVSQFTLLGNVRKGNRPSFVSAMHPDDSRPFFDEIVKMFKTAHPKIQTGEFGADMEVSLINDGPVTILVDSKNRKR